jgi:NACalpha-BTF3-like transcription factor
MEELKKNRKNIVSEKNNTNVPEKNSVIVPEKNSVIVPEKSSTRVSEKSNTRVSEKSIKQPEKPTVKKDAEQKQRAKVATQDGVDLVMQRYLSGGWSVISGLGAAQLYASRGIGSKKKVHFIRVFSSHTGITDTSKLSDEENNSYIQNAFSNMAVPVYAFVSYKEKNGSFVATRVVLEDINLRCPIRLIMQKERQEID